MSASLKVGDVLNGRYPIQSILGEGGMGAVYKASDLSSSRIWAIKEMNDTYATEEERQQAVADFAREAELLSDLDHPNLPSVTHAFEEKGRHYLVMDLVKGRTWEDIQEKGRQPLAEILDIVWQITEVLGYLHSRPRPIVFRDLKPANVMITPDGVVKLIDFGIARVFQVNKQNDTRAMGTPGYAAPEQYGKGQSDARTDIYALGVMMHQAITGVDPSLNPFKFAPVTSLASRTPESVAAIVAKAVETDREKRFANIEALRAALMALRDDPEAYDYLPSRLRTGVLPKPQSKALTKELPDQPKARPVAAGSASPQSSLGNWVGGCLPWVFMVLLLGLSLVPWVGLVAAVLAWVVVVCARTNRWALALFAVAVGVASALSSLFGVFAYNWIKELVNAGLTAWRQAG